MANTFKVITVADIIIDTAGTPYSVVYTVAGSTTTIVVGLNICNKTATDSDVTVTLVSDTGSRAVANNAANEQVILLNEVSVPWIEALEVLSGQKVVMETTDVLRIGAAHGSAIDVALSVMEIT
jgi:hypothetical protein